jgi:hypothetical protein
MFDITIITGLASIMGCLCMLFVCAAQVQELFAAARPAPAPRPWDMDFASALARPVFASFEPGLSTACA